MRTPRHSVIRHFKRLAIAAATLAVAAICRDVFSGNTYRPKIHKETNSVYYWKTVLDFNSDDYKFLRQHKIGRIYLRMFDVDIDITDKADHAHTVPVATMTMTDDTFGKLHEVLPDMEFVPVVSSPAMPLKMLPLMEREAWRGTSFHA